MRKAILMVALAFVSRSAVAEWVYVTESDSMSTYANPTTIRKAGNKVKMWDIYNYNTAETVAGKTYLSTKGQSEYDCKEEQLRTITFHSYSEDMGRGEIVYSNDKPNEWVPITPDSVGAHLWKFACGKLPIPAISNKWVKVDDSFYADPATLLKARNKVKMWHLRDYNTAETVAGKTYLSFKAQAEYDCKEDQWRLLTSSWHSEKMGVGNTVYSDAKQSDWVPITPDSRMASLWKIACKSGKHL